MARHGENIRKRRDNRWEARLVLGKDVNGHSIIKYFYGKSYADVKKKRTTYLKCINTITHQSDISYSKLLDDYLEYIQFQVKNSTYMKYKICIQNHIQPKLGDYKVKDLSTKIIDDFTTNQLISGNLKRNCGLSSKSINDQLSIIKQTLSFGKERGIETDSSVVIHLVKQREKHIKVLKEADIKRLQNNLLKDVSPVKMGILLSLYLGLRLGEVCGLKWEDIDLNQKVLYVKRTVIRVQNYNAIGTKTELFINSPKTTHSFRTIPIPQSILNIMKHYKSDDSNYLLTNSNTCMDPRNYYRKYKSILKMAGLEEYNYHALRHTFATHCVENNFDIKILSEILGHSDVATTLRRYVHPSMEQKRKYMNSINY